MSSKWKPDVFIGTSCTISSCVSSLYKYTLFFQDSNARDFHCLLCIIWHFEPTSVRPMSLVNSTNGLRLPQHKPYVHLLPFHISSQSRGLFPTIKFSSREILIGCTDFCLTQVLFFANDFVQSSNFLAIKEIGVLFLCRFTFLVQVAL